MFGSVSMGDNPFAALTTVVAPAVLTNACSVLALGTGNRIARVVDQSRAIVAQLEDIGGAGEARAGFERQLELLEKRSKLLFWALRLLYAALGAFAAAALIAVIGSALASLDYALGFQAAAIFGLLAGGLGVGGIVGGSALLVREVRLALAQTRSILESAFAVSARRP